MMKIDREQQKRLEGFFKEEVTWFPNNVLHGLLAGIMFFIAGIAMLFPYYAIEVESKSDLMFNFFMIMVACWGFYFVNMKYKNFTELENGKNVNHRVYDIIKQMPVDRIQYCMFCTGKILKYCFIFCIGFLLERNVVSYIVYGKLSIWDLVIPVMTWLVIPVTEDFLGNWNSTSK